MSLKDKTALLVDDDSELLLVMEKILANVGLHVLHAKSVREALQVVQDQRPHIILTDLNMKPETGFHFLKLMKALPMASGTPVLALSGQDDSESIRKALALGAKDFIQKPIDARTLLQKVRKHLRSEEIPMVEFAPEAKIMVTLKIPGTIVGGNDQGFIVESPVRVKTEAMITFESKEISSMEFVKPPLMRCTKVPATTKERRGFMNEFRFLGLVESQVSNLKKIISRWHTK